MKPIFKIGYILHFEIFKLEQPMYGIAIEVAKQAGDLFNCRGLWFKIMHLIFHIGIRYDKNFRFL